MRFLIDENITPDLAVIFRSHGLEAYHVNELKRHNKQIVKDDQVRKMLLKTHQILITKDDDFVKSFVGRKVPEKMLFVFELHEKNHLVEIMESNLDEICHSFKHIDFIEINPKGLRFPFENPK